MEGSGIQSRGSLLLLNVYSPDEDLGIRIKVTPCSTIEETLDQCIKRLFPGNDLNSFPLSFFRRFQDNEGYWLYKDRTLASYDLRDEDELDLMKSNVPVTTLKIKTPSNQTIIFPAEEETTVWELVHKAVCTSGQQGSFDPATQDYALFLGNTPLDEDAYVLSYEVSEGTELTVRKIDASPASEFRLIIHDKSAPISEEDKKSDPHVTIGFKGETTVWAVLKRAIKAFSVKDKNSVGLYLPSSSTWLSEDASLSSCHLSPETSVELKAIYQAFTVKLPMLPLGTSMQGYKMIKMEDIYKFREEDTIQSLYDVILFNNPHIYENSDQYFLTTRTTPQMDEQGSLFSYNVQEFEIQSTAQPIVVSYDGREEALHVNFQASVMLVITSACTKFKKNKKENYSLHLEDGTLLNEDKSLESQHVTSTTTLVLKKKDKSLPPLPTSASGGGSTVRAAGPAAPPAPAVVGGVDPRRMQKLPMGTAGHGGEAKQGSLLVGEVLVSLDALPTSLSIGKPSGKYNESVNIWAEPEGHEYYLPTENLSSETPLKAGTINKLVVHLSHPDNFDARFMQAFLMTYLSFTNPKTLLNKLIERYTVPSTYQSGEAKRIQFRVCNVLKHWLTKYYDDFDHEMIQIVTEFIDEVLVHDGHGSIINILRGAVVTRTCGLKSRQTTNNRLTVWSSQDKPPPPKMKTGKTTFTSIFDFDEEEVARQLTIKEFLYYREIKVPELLDQAWNKKNAQQKAPNVLHMIDNFNNCSLWVAHLILEPPKLKDRVKRWESLIKIAQYLAQYNNFNLLTSFIAGMNNSSILRLKWTKSSLTKASQQALEKLEKLMSAEGSYSAYRSALKTINPPCIPYIGVHLSDLVFIEDGNPDELKGLVNWEKRAMVFKVIEILEQHQATRYNLTFVPVIGKLIEQLNPPTEKELYAISLEREPRGAQKNQIQ